MQLIFFSWLNINWTIKRRRERRDVVTITPFLSFLLLLKRAPNRYFYLCIYSLTAGFLVLWRVRLFYRVLRSDWPFFIRLTFSSSSQFCLVEYCLICNGCAAYFSEEIVYNERCQSSMRKINQLLLKLMSETTSSIAKLLFWLWCNGTAGWWNILESCNNEDGCLKFKLKGCIQYFALNQRQGGAESAHKMLE